MNKTKGLIILDKDTTFEGEIETEQLILEGKVDGVVKARAKVLLKNGSYLKGEVFTRLFNMIEGSRFEGNLFVNTEVDRFEEIIEKKYSYKKNGNSVENSEIKEELNES